MKGYLEASWPLIVAPLFLIFVYPGVSYVSRSTRLRFYEVQKLKSCLLTDDIYADDVVDSEGVPILSWRVVYANTYGDWNPTRPIDLSKPWYDDDNMKASKCKPERFRFLPSYNSSDYGDKGREETTCLVRIKEVHEWLKKGETTLEERGDKAYLVLLAPEYAFRWTKPYDVSWKDLASGKVKLRDDSIYLTVDGFVCDLKETPKTIEEWRDFCGVDE